MANIPWKIDLDMQKVMDLFNEEIEQMEIKPDVKLRKVHKSLNVQCSRSIRQPMFDLINKIIKRELAKKEG